jgi:hypothetical protein
MDMLRSALAILAGIAALTISSFAIEAVVNPLLLRAFPVALPNDAAMSHNLPAMSFTFAYSLTCVGFGGYLTARLARHAPARHAAMMGAIQAALTVAAMLADRDKAPLAAWIIGILLMTPAAWCGGVIQARFANRRGLNSSVHVDTVRTDAASTGLRRGAS